MKATSNAETELAMGREPSEMSRPTTTTRSGFMESMGSGVHVLMSAKTALQIGARIGVVIGFTSTSTDKAGRSIPAPGRGALTIAREILQNTCRLSLTLDTALTSSPPTTSKFLNGLFMNMMCSAKRLSFASLKVKWTTHMCPTGSHNS